MSNRKRILIRPVVIGDSGVGKSALLTKFVHGEFIQHHKATIGADFFTKDLVVEEKYTVKLQIWDTAGQERFRSLGSSFYRGTEACIIVYDITNKESFDRVDFWREHFIKNAHLNAGELKVFPFLLLANKFDLVDVNSMKLAKGYGGNDSNSLLVFGFCREVNVEIVAIMRLCLEYHGYKWYFDGYGLEYAKKHNMSYYETSALTGKNIDEAMRDICIKVDQAMGDQAPIFPFFEPEVFNESALDLDCDESNQSENSYAYICGC